MGKSLFQRHWPGPHSRRAGVLQRQGYRTTLPGAKRGRRIDGSPHIRTVRDEVPGRAILPHTTDPSQPKGAKRGGDINIEPLMTLVTRLYGSTRGIRLTRPGIGRMNPDQRRRIADGGTDGSADVARHYRPGKPRFYRRRCYAGLRIASMGEDGYQAGNGPRTTQEPAEPIQYVSSAQPV